MSRCFPFPPPGYLRNGERSEALIESIKLQREIEKAKKDKEREIEKSKKDKERKKKEKKEKKREKKEKEKRRKEKEERKQREGATTSLASDGKKLKHIDKSKEINAADGKLRKVEDYENDQLERSGITEEHEQPVTSREPCCLSDSTQTSGKRKRSSSPTSSQDHGTAIKIRLPLRKHREPEESKPGHHVGSSSGTVRVADSLTKDSRGNNHQLQQEVRVTNAECVRIGDSSSKDPRGGNHQSQEVRFTNAECVRIGDSSSKDPRGSNHLVQQQELATNAETKQILSKSDSRHCKAVQDPFHGDVLVTNPKPDGKLAKMASLYNSLFQNPPTCELFNSEDDQDWLFSSELINKKVKPDTETDAFRCSTSSSLWPRAQLLPEVDMYALPYTVPF